MDKEYTERTKWALELERELKNKINESDILTEEIAQQKRDAQQTAEEAQETEKELQALIQQNRQNAEEFYAELSAMRNSLSWKITKPLREVRLLGQKIISKSKALGRIVYKKLPIVAELKGRLQTYAYSRKLLKTTQAYKHWKSRWDYLLDTEDWAALPKSAKSPRVSIIIPVYGQLGYTLQCLRSIFTCSEVTNHEIILVDDCSPDDSYETLQKLCGVRLFQNSENHGFIRTCNFGATVAKGEILLFLNNDTEVSPGWIDSIVAVFDQQDKAGVVGSKLIYPNGRLQEAGGILWKDGSAWNFGNGEHPDAPAFNYLKEVDYCSGASFAIPRALFVELGSFDENYLPAYCEDSDLCMKVRQAGYKVFYQPFSQIIHYEGVSNGKDVTEGIKAYQVKNQKKLLERWKSTWEEENHAPGESVFLARERSRNRRLILVIDHYVPQPDRDAGSKTMIQFMGAFQDLDLVVKFWPDNIYYDPDYTPLLQHKGIETYYGDPFMNFEDWCRSYLGYFNFILLTRPVTAESKIAILQKHKRPDTPIIFYGVDIHHLRLERMYEINRDDKCLAEAKMEKERELKIWQQADMILYPSEEESEYVAALDSTHTVKAIQPYYFDDFPQHSALTTKGRNGILFVAGFSHPPNVDAARWLIEDIMPLVWEELENVQLFLVGSNPTESVKSLASSKVEVTGYVSEVRLQEFYKQFRVAVVPLTYGAGVKSKVVEAISLGIPLVTTPAGAQGLPGLQEVATVTDDAIVFSQRIIQLYRDEDAWLTSSHCAVDYAMSRFSRNSMSSQWKDIFNETAKTRNLQV